MSSKSFSFLKWGNRLDISENDQTASCNGANGFCRIAQPISDGDRLVISVNFTGPSFHLRIEPTSCGPDRIAVCSDKEGCSHRTGCRFISKVINMEAASPSCLVMKQSDYKFFVMTADEVEVTTFGYRDFGVPKTFFLNLRLDSETNLIKIVNPDNVLVDHAQLLSDIVDRVTKLEGLSRNEKSSVTVDFLADQESLQCEEAWSTCDSVGFINKKLLRLTEDNSRKTHYAFRIMSFGLDTSITFVILKRDTTSDGSLTFGVTTTDPHKVDLVALPASGRALKETGHSDTWFVAPDLVDNVEEGKLVTIKRTKDGIHVTSVTKTESVLTLDPYLKVYPFFLFDGSVSEIGIKKYDLPDAAEQREPLECYMCRTRAAVTFVKVWKDMLFCQQCIDIDCDQ